MGLRAFVGPNSGPVIPLATGRFSDPAKRCIEVLPVVRAL